MKRIRVRWLLAVFSLVSFYIMMTLNYDSDFQFTSLLPLTYFFVLVFILRDDIIADGLGAGALTYFYAFRMCILPLICAFGNFYIEPDKNDYIQYYNWGILLISIECVIVFCSLRYFTNFFIKKGKRVLKVEITQSNHELIKWVVGLLTITIIFLQAGLNVNYYTPITLQAEEIIMYELGETSKGAWWYINDLLSTWWRPLITIYLIYSILQRKIEHPYLWIVLIAGLNIYFMSDRRIYALLVGGYALYYAMSVTKSVIVKRFISLFLLSGVFTTLFLGFYTSATADLEMMARTFQHYFSGPTLNALSLRVFDIIGVKPIDFVYLLLNDFQTFTALYKTIELPNYFDPLFGYSQGLWVPMTVGSLRYFGIFFPIVLIFFVYYIKQCDFWAKHSSSSIYSMIYYYIGVCVSCYMVMYTVELICYFIIVTGSLYRALIYFDQRMSFSNNKIIINKHEGASSCKQR